MSVSKDQGMVDSLAEFVKVNGIPIIGAGSSIHRARLLHKPEWEVRFIPADVGGLYDVMVYDEHVDVTPIYRASGSDDLILWLLANGVFGD